MCWLVVTCCGASACACGVVVDEQRTPDGRKQHRTLIPCSSSGGLACRRCSAQAVRGRAATMRLFWQPRMALMGPSHLARAQVVQEADGYQAPVQAALHATYP